MVSEGAGDLVVVSAALAEQSLTFASDLNRQKEPKLRERGARRPIRSQESAEDRTGTNSRRSAPPQEVQVASSADVSDTLFWHPLTLIVSSQLVPQGKETNWPGHWKNEVLENYCEKVEERI